MYVGLIFPTITSNLEGPLSFCHNTIKSVQYILQNLNWHCKESEFATQFKQNNKKEHYHRKMYKEHTQALISYNSPLQQ
jgi:hypothetical protein